MALTDIQAIIEQINSAKHILITGKQDHDGDIIASALALFLVLQKINKRADMAFYNYEFPSEYEWLPKHEIKTDLGELQQLTIKINTTNTIPGELKYEKKDNELQIQIIPKKGMLKTEDITTETSDYKYDLIIVLGSPDLESLGGIYNSNPDFFYHTPIINIDHSAINEQYGQINAIDLNSSSVSEILYHFIEKLDPNLIDDEIATCLYTGMTIKTRSFKINNLTPTTLHVASKLITKGADRESVIQNLYRTKSVNMLKLWGRALARLEFDNEFNIAWTQLTAKDFVLTNTDIKNVKGLLEELINENNLARVVILIYEKDNYAYALVSTKDQYNALRLTREFEPTGDRSLAKIVFPNKSILEFQTQLLESIKNMMKQRQV